MKKIRFDPQILRDRAATLRRAAELLERRAAESKYTGTRSKGKHSTGPYQSTGREVLQ